MSFCSLKSHKQHNFEESKLFRSIQKQKRHSERCLKMPEMYTCNFNSPAMTYTHFFSFIRETIYRSQLDYEVP